MRETQETLASRHGIDLEALVDRAPDGIFVADIAGRYTYVNEAACRLLGYAPEERGEVIGKTIMDLISPDELPRLERTKARMQRGDREVGEWSLRRKDGTRVPVEVTANILPNGQWQGFVRDISERKAQEAERDALLGQTESDRRWLQAVLDTMPLGVVLYRPDGSISFNRRTEDMLGMKLSPDKGPEQYVERIRWPDGSRATRERLPLVRAFNGETLIGEEYLVVRADGTRIPSLASAAPIRDSRGGRIGAVGVFQDVSERMRMEEAIRKSEQLLQAVFDILPVGVWIADAGGRIVGGNPAGERLWGGARYVALERYGEYKGWWVENGKPIAAEEWALARAVARGETSLGELVRIQCFDGSFRTILNSAAPLRDLKGAITGAIAVNEDVTSMQHTQEQLRAAVRAREEILATVTHDLRNPLAGLMMGAAAVELKARELPGGEPVRELAATLMDITRRMSGMVDDLLAVAVSRTGGGSLLRLAPVSGSALLARAAEAARPPVARDSLELRLDVAGELPTVHADADRILRVFGNLIDNALKFTAPGGCVTLGAEPSMGGVRYWVANSGPALPAKQLEAMFRPFWQAGRDRRGAGLGLAICRSIVEAHGGTIWAEPAEGERVRVCFVIPGQPAEPPVKGP